MEDNKKLGLVLSGGGAKGAYQLGMLKVLKEKGLLNEITHISGASIGAINAVLYLQNDMELMEKVWNELEQKKIFDIDEFNITEETIGFTRKTVTALVRKNINMKKISASPVVSYASVSRLITRPDGSTVKEAHYFRMNGETPDRIESIILASSAFPVLFEPVTIDGEKYIDGGMTDNDPVKPLYDDGVRDFIVIGLTPDKKLQTDLYPDAEFKLLYPSHDLGGIFTGTLNFYEDSKDFKKKLGMADAERYIKTVFEKDETYIRLEKALAEQDYNRLVTAAKYDANYERLNTSVNSNLDKFNSIADKYKDFKL